MLTSISLRSLATSSSSGYKIIYIYMHIFEFILLQIAIFYIPTDIFPHILNQIIINQRTEAD